MTLLELTTVILILLTLVSVLSIGARAWKQGADRASCLIRLRTIQSGVRSYQNIYGYDSGIAPGPVDGSASITTQLHAKGLINDQLYDMMQGRQECPGGGTYLVDQDEVFPPPGTLFVSCSLGESRNHQLEMLGVW